MESMVATRFSILTSAASNWFAFAATLAVSFILTPYLINTLGKPRYDVWCVVEAVLAYFTLLDMGLAACLVRHVAKHAATGAMESLNRMASSCLALYTAAGLIAMTLGIPLAFALAPGLTGKLGDSEDVLPFMLLMLGNLTLTLPMSTFPSILDGLDRYAEKSLIRILFLALRTIAIVLVLNRSSGLLRLGLIYTAANLCEHAAMAGLAFLRLRGLRLSYRLVDRTTLRHVRVSSIDAFLAMLAGRVTVQTGAIVVGLFLPIGAVTYYATASRLVEYAKTLLRTITATLTPGVSAMEARGEWDAIRRLMLAATRWVLYIVLPVNVGLYCFGRPFLHRWVGPEFVQGSFPAVSILAATLSLGVAQSVASRILYGLGRLRPFARMALVEAVLNIALMLTITSYGVEGVAIAVTIPNVLFCCAVLVYTCRLLNLSFGTYLLAWRDPLLALLVPAGIWFVAGEPDPHWPAIARTIALGLIPYAILVLILELRRELPGNQRRTTHEQVIHVQPAIVATAPKVLPS